tara:strand:+ start:218 stop:1279 length:1062 start_codon:yes stop_codon:yes gene_type:complete
MIKKEVVVSGSYPPPYGGIAYVVKSHMDSVLNKNFNLNLIKKPNIANCNIMTKIYFLLYYYFKFFNKIRETQAQITHIHSSSYGGFWRYSIAIFVSKLLNSKVVLHIHGARFDDFYTNSVFPIRYTIQQILNSVDRLIVLTPEWSKFFEKFIKDKSIIKILPNGVDTGKYTTTHKESKNKVLIHFGCTARKGINEIVNSLPEIIDDNTRLILVDNVERQSIIDKIKEYTDNVDYFVNVSENEKVKLLSSSDILILPTFAEGMPILILEAMSSGLAIVTTAVGGIPSVLRNRENCIFAEPGNSESLQSSISTLKNNQKLMKNMKEANRQKVEKLYSLGKITDNLENIYNQLLNQ